jgi:glycogen(starch) synthase
MDNIKADYLFEVSWEVCNKVGGIYTVIKSKSSEMMKLYKNYFLVGPYFEHNAKTDFVSMDPPEEFKKIFDDLRNEGVICHYGKWLEIKGKPYTMLIESNGLLAKKNEIKGKFWEYYKIDSIRAGWDFEEPSIWSYAVGMLIEKLQNTALKEKKIVGHFHEWLSGFGLLYLRKYCPSVATVFTTHATVLGRTLSSKGIDIYGYLENINVEYEIYYNNIEAKHLTESATAKNAHVFTTVSEITGIEAERFLGRKPDVLVLNGLDLEKFPSFEEISIKHITSRDKIREFLTYYFFPYYTFDVNKNIIAYTIGRFEYENKGYDLIIKALGLLNQRLKQQKSDKTLSMMFWVPMQQYGMSLDVLENKNYYMHIKNYVLVNSPEILKKIIYDFISKKEGVEELLTESFVKEIKKDIVAFSREGNPPLSTHNLDENNIVLSALRENGLLNRKEDPVKVIIEPIYLDGMDGFMDLIHYDVMVGCHLGLFPSYYEPWGYTPLESAALGVPALTTDMSGFGRYIKSQNPENKGIIVLDRFRKPDQEVITAFCDILQKYLDMDHSDRVNCKLKAKSLSGYADWELLIKNYVDAHNMAVDRVNK